MPRRRATRSGRVPPPATAGRRAGRSRPPTRTSTSPRPAWPPFSTETVPPPRKADPDRFYHALLHRVRLAWGCRRRIEGLCPLQACWEGSTLLRRLGGGGAASREFKRSLV